MFRLMNLQDVQADFPASHTIVETIRFAYKENAPTRTPSSGTMTGRTRSTSSRRSVSSYPAHPQPRRWRCRGRPGQQHSEFQWGGVPFYIHKIGKAETDDPWQARPSHTTAAGWLGGQMRLSFDGPR